HTGALPSALLDKLVSHGDEIVARPFWTTFWAAVLAGWLLALVAWLVQASTQAGGAVALIWFLTVPVGLAKLDHSVATTIHAWAALFEGDAGIGEALGWWGATLLGNVLGGVFIVSVLNYGQVHSGEEERGDGRDSGAEEHA
ncbi:MAG TPA: formate/nitrite transporter family protein, partial [Solirubrobacteraceae bacterium]|nr:formate/nitrite transporter family protein [Solirubrobacteraceae bacterium]